MPVRIRYVTRSSTSRKPAATDSLRSLYRRVPSRAATQSPRVSLRSKALEDSLPNRYSRRFRSSDIGTLSKTAGKGRGGRLRSPQSTDLEATSWTTRSVATNRVAGGRFGLTSRFRRDHRSGGRSSRTWRGGCDWGWGFRGHRHRHGHHHHHYWLGLGLWCGFGYWGGYYADYWYHHYRYHPYRFLYWWCPDYYYYGVPVFVYPPSSVVVYDETGLEPRDKERDTERDTARPVGEAPTTTESIIANHVKLGDFYFREGKYDKAAESYLRALAYAPDDASIHFILADALFGMGDYHYAAFIINKALRLDPEMAKATADKRDFYRDPKEFGKQLETLRKYISEKPYDSAAHLVLGYNLRFSGEPALARKAFERVLEISPHNQAAKLFLKAMDAPESKPAAGKPVSEPASQPDKTPHKKN